MAIKEQESKSYQANAKPQESSFSSNMNSFGSNVKPAEQPFSAPQPVSEPSAFDFDKKEEGFDIISPQDDPTKAQQDFSTFDF